MALGTPVAAAVAYSAQNGTSVSPAYPTGILSTDVVLLITGQKPSTANGGTVTTPSGWTLLEETLAQGGYGTTLAAGTGNTNLRIYSWNTPVAGQTGNLTVTIGTNSISWAFMLRIPKGAGNAAFGSADGSRATAPTVNVPFTVNLTNGASATNFQSGDLAIWAMCIPDPATTPAQFSGHSVTATGATFATAVEFNEPDSTAGLDIGGFSAYASVSSGSSTAAPSITVTAAGTVTNVRGPVAMVRVRELPATQTLTPNLYTNDQTFFAATVTTSNTLAPALYTNDQVFYDPTVAQVQPAQTLTASLYTNDQTFYDPTASASNTLTPDLYTNDQTFYGATVSTTRTLEPALYTNDQTFYSPTATATYTLAPGLYTNAQTFFDPTVTATYALTPDLYTNNQTFFDPTVTAGAVALTPDLYTNIQAFFAPTVTTGAVALTADLYTNDQTFYAASITQTGGPQALLPDLYANAQTFYSPTITTGAVDVAPGLYTNNQTFFAPAISVLLSPALYTNAQAFYAPAVSTSYTLTPALYTNAQTFYAPSVSTGSVTLAPALYTNTQTFFAPAVTTSNTLQPQLVTNDQVFYSPTVVEDKLLEPDLYTNDQTFFAPSVSTSYTLAPQGYVDDGYVNPGYVGPNTFSTQIFYAPAVTSTRALLPSLATNTSTFFAAAVENSLYTITKAQALRLRHIWQLHGLSPSPLVVGPDVRTTGDIVQAITEASGTTTVATTSAGTVFSGDPGLMIDELAALHGLTAPLVVSPTSRTAGAITQVFGQSSGVTTVTRQ